MNPTEKLTTYFIKNNIAKEDIESIVQAFRFRKVEKNRMILQEREICQHIYFITKGMLRVYGIFQGKERTYGFFMEESIRSILDSFINKKPSDYYVEAIEDCELFMIDFQNWNKLLHQIPAMQKIYIEILEVFITVVSKRLTTYHNDFFTVSERYQHFLADPIFTPSIIDRLSNKIIASFLFVSPETLSRIKK